MTIGFDSFWYIVAESHELTTKNILARTILDENLVCFRDANNQPVVLRDRCLHRCGRLANGSLHNGKLRCPYHGWVYDHTGKVVEIPSMNKPPDQLQTLKYKTCEQDGYIYVCLKPNKENIKPFKMAYYHQPGFSHVRLQNLFKNNLSNCVENFIDIPHTAFVHHGIFRSYRKEAIKANILQQNGEVHVTYANEKRNLGSFNWFLNPRGEPIKHTDSFFMPNITHVTYALESKWKYIITSQSVPITNDTTLVYTDLSYHFGMLTPFIRRIIKRQAQKVIDQDIFVLNQQMHVIKQYGQHFYDTPADKIHAFVSQIHATLGNKQDPRLLPLQQIEVTFYV